MSELSDRKTATHSILPEAKASVPQQRRTLLGRAVWLVFATLCLAVFSASLSLSFHQLAAPCTGSVCSPSQLNPAQAHVLMASLGLSLSAYAFIVLLIDALSALTWISVGVFLWRKLDRVFVLLLALQEAAQGIINGNAFAQNGVADVLTRAHSPWAVPALLLEILNQVLLFFVLALFPSGRFVPRWTRWVAALWVATEAGFFVAQISPSLRSSILPFNNLFPLIILIGLIAQVYRYRSISTPVERQQTKWVVLGLLATNALQVALLLAQHVITPLRQADSLYGPVASLVVTLVFVVGPVTFIIAVLRYRLYDIDVIIRRTLVYGALTAILAAVYFSVVIGAQAAVGTVDPQASQSPVIVVASTLLIAALFNPLRHRLQALIDRRFYRGKYDAARTLEAFGATLRTETDLAELSEHLVAVVRDTMQPASVSLWLAAPGRPGQHSPERENDNEN